MLSVNLEVMKLDIVCLRAALFARCINWTHMLVTPQQWLMPSPIVLQGLLRSSRTGPAFEAVTGSKFSLEELLAELVHFNQEAQEEHRTFEPTLEGLCGKPGGVLRNGQYSMWSFDVRARACSQLA